jgi:hypothetical protein
MEETLLKLWRFVNYETEVAEFEQWVYATSELENQLSSDLYFLLISVPYKDKYEVGKLRDVLKNWLQSQPQLCTCISWTKHQRLQLGWERPWTDDAWQDFDFLQERSPWLHLIRCKGCDQQWYMFVDTDGDDYYLHRLSFEDMQALELGKWPNDFDNLPNNLPANYWLYKRGYK